MTTEHRAAPGRPGTVPAAGGPTTGGGAPVEVSRGRGRLLGFGVTQFVVCELAALAILLHRSVVVLLLGPLALVIAVLALGRRNGRWLYEDWLVRRDFRRRRVTGLQVVPMAPVGAPAGAADPRLAALRELHPRLQITEVADRSGDRIGVVNDGRCCSAMLTLEPVDGARAGPADLPGGPALRLDLVADALRTRDVTLTSIQVITHTVPAPAGYLTETAPVARSYGSLAADVVPARRSTWVVARLDPLGAPAAVAARGGGRVGAHRALLGTVSRLSAALRFAGLGVRPVGAAEALDVLSLTAGATGPGGTAGAHRTAESWDCWAVDGTVQACFWVRGWPAARPLADPRLLARLGDVRSRFNVVSLTLTGEDASGIGVRAVVRVAGGSREELEHAVTDLQRLVPGARLQRLNGQHAPAVLESLPLGGTAS